MCCLYNNNKLENPSSNGASAAAAAARLSLSLFQRSRDRRFANRAGLVLGQPRTERERKKQHVKKKKKEKENGERDECCCLLDALRMEAMKALQKKKKKQKKPKSANSKKIEKSNITEASKQQSRNSKPAMSAASRLPAPKEKEKKGVRENHGKKTRQWQNVQTVLVGAQAHHTSAKAQAAAAARQEERKEAVRKWRPASERRTWSALPMRLAADERGRRAAIRLWSDQHRCCAAVGCCSTFAVPATPNSQSHVAEPPLAEKEKKQKESGKKKK